MSEHRRSYLKTIIAAGILTGGGIVVLAAMAAASWNSAESASWAMASLWVVAFLLAGLGVGLTALVTAGGLLSLHRDTLEARGVPYARHKPREWEAGLVVRAIRGAIRPIALALSRAPGRLALRPGEVVEVRSLEEILATLDDMGTLDRLPFMSEMSAFCGRRFRVFRRVEKIHDYVHHTGLRRIHDTILLEQLRCDGGHHGGCQASCHLLWKEAWLRRVTSGARPVFNSSPQGPPARAADLRPLPIPDPIPLSRRVDDSGSDRYICQMTEVHNGTTPLKWGDPRHYLRDLLLGNVRLGPLFEGVAIRLFNVAQYKRGGAAYPNWTMPNRRTSPHQVLDLEPGELVRVRAKHEIAQTLNFAGRNRGLWFDAEMIRYCGGTYRVSAKVDRLIEEKSGRLLNLTNACVILEGVSATGEHMAFCPQNESIFWREIWLERTETQPAISR